MPKSLHTLKLYINFASINKGSIIALYNNHNLIIYYMKTYYTLAELEAKGIVLNSNNVWSLERAKEVQALLAPFWECEIKAVSYNSSEISSIHCMLKNDIVPIIANYYEHRGKKEFLIYQDETDALKNIDRYKLGKIREKHDTINKMYVPTTKKIAQHIEVANKIYLEAKKVDEINGGEVEQFLKSIEGLPVKWWSNNTKGEIIKNGIILKFEINDGFVSKKIETYYKVPSTVESFLALSNNQYKAK